MMRFILGFLWAIMLFTAFSTSAQNAGERFYLLEDSSLSVSATQALRLFKEHRFLQQTQHHFNPGFTKSVYWLALTVDSTIRPDSLRLIIGNPHINKIEFYTISHDAAALLYTTGDHYLFSHRPIETTRFSFPLVKNSYLYLVRIDKHNESLQLTFETTGIKGLAMNESESYMITGILTGIILLLLIFGFYLSIIARKWLYILYVLYAASGWLWVLADLGFGFKYLWPDSVWFASRSRPVFSQLTIILSIQYLMLYVGRIRWRLVHHLLNIVTVIASVFLLMWLLPLDVYDSSVVSWLMLKFIPAIAAVYVILGLTALLSEAIKKNTMALFYLAALIPLMLLVFTNLLNHSGLINITGTTLDYYGVAIGYVIEVIILTFGLVFSFNSYRLEKERLQLKYQIQQKENARAVIETEARERKRIADELHDIAGSMLSAARLNISSVREKKEWSDSETHLKLQKAEEAITIVSDSVRTLSHALSPVMLQQHGFKKSIEKAASFFNTPGKLKTEVLVMGFETYDPSLEHIYPMFYSIVYELLNNIVKHANASHVILQVIEHSESISLMIEDNGKGLMETDLKNTKGLSGILSKINYFNGTIAFDNTPTGLVISIEIPTCYEKTGNIS